MALNLIPPKIKEMRKTKEALRQVLIGLWAMLLIVIIFSIALKIYASSLDSDQKSWEERIEQQKSKDKTLIETENKIQKINSKLSKIDSILANRINWSEVLESIGSATPKAVQVTSLNLDKNNSQISIQGVALTRKDIALMKQKLEENGRFKNVVFSTSSYNQQTNDYNFNLNLSLDIK
jgi:Tfp pilus assembly protein PilN